MLTTKENTPGVLLALNPTAHLPNGQNVPKQVDPIRYAFKLEIFWSRQLACATSGGVR